MDIMLSHPAHQVRYRNYRMFAFDRENILYASSEGVLAYSSISSDALSTIIMRYNTPIPANTLLYFSIELNEVIMGDLVLDESILFDIRYHHQNVPSQMSAIRQPLSVLPHVALSHDIRLQYDYPTPDMVYLDTLDIVIPHHSSPVVSLELHLNTPGSTFSILSPKECYYDNEISGNDDDSDDTTEAASIDYHPNGGSIMNSAGSFVNHNRVIIRFTKPILSNYYMYAATPRILQLRCPALHISRQLSAIVNRPHTLAVVMHHETPIHVNAEVSSSPAFLKDTINQLDPSNGSNHSQQYQASITRTATILQGLPVVIRDRGPRVESPHCTRWGAALLRCSFSFTYEDLRNISTSLLPFKTTDTIQFSLSGLRARHIKTFIQESPPQSSPSGVGPVRSPVSTQQSAQPEEGVDITPDDGPPGDSELPWDLPSLDLFYQQITNEYTFGRGLRASSRYTIVADISVIDKGFKPRTATELVPKVTTIFRHHDHNSVTPSTISMPVSNILTLAEYSYLILDHPQPDLAAFELHLKKLRILPSLLLLSLVYNDDLQFDGKYTQCSLISWIPSPKRAIQDALREQERRGLLPEQEPSPSASRKDLEPLELEEFRVPLKAYQQHKPDVLLGTTTELALLLPTSDSRLTTRFSQRFTSPLHFSIQCGELYLKAKSTSSSVFKDLLTQQQLLKITGMELPTPSADAKAYQHQRLTNSVSESALQQSQLVQPSFLTNLEAPVDISSLLQHIQKDTQEAVASLSSASGPPSQRVHQRVYQTQQTTPQQFSTMVVFSPGRRGKSHGDVTDVMEYPWPDYDNPFKILFLLFYILAASIGVATIVGVTASIYYSANCCAGIRSTLRQKHSTMFLNAVKLEEAKVRHEKQKQLVLERQNADRIRRHQRAVDEYQRQLRQQSSPEGDAGDDDSDQCQIPRSVISHSMTPYSTSRSAYHSITVSTDSISQQIESTNDNSGNGTDESVHSDELSIDEHESDPNPGHTDNQEGHLNLNHDGEAFISTVASTQGPDDLAVRTEHPHVDASTAETALQSTIPHDDLNGSETQNIHDKDLKHNDQNQEDHLEDPHHNNPHALHVPNHASAHVITLPASPSVIDTTALAPGESYQPPAGLSSRDHAQIPKLKSHTSLAVAPAATEHISIDIGNSMDNGGSNHPESSRIDRNSHAPQSPSAGSYHEPRGE